MNKVVVPYDHDSADLQPIYLALTNQRHPSTDAWKPAYRDIVNGQKVVWAKFPERSGLFNVWIQDRTGTRLFEKRAL